jgi:hypothetical protein
MKFKKYLVEDKTEMQATTKGTTVGRLQIPFNYVIDTEKMTVTASWGYGGKHKHVYKAKSVKQAWWNWYNPWKKGGFMKYYDDQIKKEGGLVDYSK